MSSIWTPQRNIQRCIAGRHALTRRRFLRGAGGAAVALPFLLSEEGDLRAQAAPPVERFIGVFVALGLPEEVLTAGFDGSLDYPVNPIAPLGPHQSKLAMLKGIDVLTQVTGVETLHGT